MFGETVTRIRPAATGSDRYGNPTYTDAETAVPGAAFAPEDASREPIEVGRASVVTQPALYFYLSQPDIAAGDRIRVQGRIYDVDGDPAPWRSPWGAPLKGLVVRLKLVRG